MNATTPKKRNNTKSSSTRMSIIKTAEELVTQNGISALTLDAIATECGITVQTIYNRVGGRSAILIAIAEKALEENRLYMRDAYSHSGTARERLLAATEGYLRFATEKPHAFRLMANPPEDPQALKRITELVQKHNGQLEQVIRDGISAGDIDNRFDPAKVATALWATANGLLALLWRADRQAMTGDDLQIVMNTGIKIVMDGLFKPSAN